MTVVVADIGGTHARLAYLDHNNAITAPEKFASKDFLSLQDALTAYCSRHDRQASGTLFIATAATSSDDNRWVFLNKNSWVLDRSLLAKQGWHTPVILNDFIASAYGALELPDSARITLKNAVEKKNLPRAILGPGTGLGMAYMIPLPDGKWHVEGTAGGHMLAATLTEEQQACLSLARQQRGGSFVAIPEDVASGRGLPALYQAVCAYHDLPPQYETIEAMLAHADDTGVLHTLRLFHEFLGLFAHNTVVTTNAFGGLYLDGGIMSVLRAADRLDIKSFEKFFLLDVAPSVRTRLDSTPIWLINDPFVALRGLALLAGRHA